MPASEYGTITWKAITVAPVSQRCNRIRSTTSIPEMVRLDSRFRQWNGCGGELDSQPFSGSSYTSSPAWCRAGQRRPGHRFRRHLYLDTEAAWRAIRNLLHRSHRRVRQQPPDHTPHSTILLSTEGSNPCERSISLSWNLYQNCTQGIGSHEVWVSGKRHRAGKGSRWAATPLLTVFRMPTIWWNTASR